MVQPHSSPAKNSSVERWLPRAGLLAAALFTAMFGLTVIPRLLFPYDLDFIEDGLLMTSLRVANGQPVFIAPQAEFTPHVYMPLYTWLGGSLFRLFGVGFIPLRGLSLAATLLCALLIFFVARRESGQAWLALLCAGLFLGGYRLNGFIYDVARVDSLFLALSLAGLVLGVYGNGRGWGQVGAATFLALAFLTKQTAILLGLGLGVFLLFRVGRQAWRYWGVWVALTAGPVLWLNVTSEGWFWYYTVHIAGINPVTLERLLTFAIYEIPVLMGGLTAMTGAAALLAIRRAGWRGLPGQPWFIWLALGLVISGMGRASVGGNLNNRLMAYSLLCLGPALLAHEWAHRPALRPRRLDAVIVALALLQFALGVYNPWRYIPTPAMRQSGDRLVETIATTDGEVLVLLHPYYAWLAGKSPSAQIAALWHARERGTLPLPSDFAARLAAGHYALIISDDSIFETDPALQQLLTAAYGPPTALSATESPPTLAGLHVQPRLVYRPQKF